MKLILKMINTIILNLNCKINLIIWKKEKNNFINIFLYNKTKQLKFFMFLNKNQINYDKETNSLIINKNTLNYKNNKLANLLNNFFKSWDFYFFSKLKFKGKGFRIKFFKKIKLVKFFFGKSHKTIIFFKKIFLKKINKYKFIIKNIDKNIINVNEKKITNIRPLNLYTLRGLRKSRQTVFKRKGKKGTYI